MPRDVEDGYTRINNEIVEAFAAAKFNGREFQCLWYLLRMTYGWQRKECAVSLSEWERGTGINRRHVNPILKDLAARNIVTITESRGRGQKNVYGFNKYFEQWEKVPSTGTHKSTVDGTLTGTEKVPSTGTEKVPSTGTHIKKGKKERNKISCIESESIYKEGESFPIPTPTKTNSRGLHKNIDPRKVDDNGIIPSGKGETPFEVYREVFTHTPGHTVIADIMQTAIDLPKWRELCCEWARRGYKPANVAGLLDVYVNGWRSGNGYGKPAQEQPDIDYLKKQVITGNGKGLTQEELDEIIRTSDF